MAKEFKLKPLEDRIIVQPSEAEETTASGLVIPDTAKEKPVVGTVVAVGPGKFNEDGDERIPVDVSVGTPSSTRSTAAPSGRTPTGPSTRSSRPATSSPSSAREHPVVAGGAREPRSRRSMARPDNQGGSRWHRSS